MDMKMTTGEITKTSSKEISLAFIFIVFPAIQPINTIATKKTILKNNSNIIFLICSSVGEKKLKNAF